LTLDQKLLLYAQQFEDQHAPENITTTLREAAAEIERLREWNAEIALNAREFVAENEKLRAALEWIAETTLTQPGLMVEKARAALEAAHDQA
jgi:hypothetical protein